MLYLIAQCTGRTRFGKRYWLISQKMCFELKARLWNCTFYFSSVSSSCSISMVCSEGQAGVSSSAWQGFWVQLGCGECPHQHSNIFLATFNIAQPRPKCLWEIPRAANVQWGLSRWEAAKSHGMAARLLSEAIKLSICQHALKKTIQASSHTFWISRNRVQTDCTQVMPFVIPCHPLTPSIQRQQGSFFHFYSFN